MEFSTILFEKRESIAIITMNRPQIYNALSRTVLIELDAAMDEIEKDDDIHAFIITGAGEKAFVSGADINELNGLGSVDGVKWMFYGQKVFTRIERCLKPSIAAVNGYALGGGCELSMVCDIRIASENAKFGQPEINLGNMPGWGATQRLQRLVGISRAKQMIFTGEFLNARKACEWGLCSDVLTDRRSLLDEAERLAKRISSKGSIALACCKQAIQYGSDAPIDTGMALEAYGVGICLSTEDQTEGVNAFLEKRKPVFKGE